jgi:hypothetical protein
VVQKKNKKGRNNKKKWETPLTRENDNSPEMDRLKLQNKAKNI